MGPATGVLAYTSLERSDHVSAVGLYQENIARYTALGDMRGIGGAIAGVSGVALAHGQSSMAARLIGAARATIAEIGVARLGNKGLSDRIEVRIRATISPLAFQSLGKQVTRLAGNGRLPKPRLCTEWWKVHACLHFRMQPPVRDSPVEKWTCCTSWRAG